MPEIFIYLLKANLSLVLFYFGYRLLLRRLTFYRLNRFYLLFGLLFSAGYPLVDISGWMAARQAVTLEVTYFIPDWERVPVREFNWWPLVTGLFWLGVIYFGWRLLARLISLWKLHAESRPSTWRLFRYRQVFDQVKPFTFWRNIYLNVHQHNESELVDIFSHEEIHASELHTVDVLLAELCSVFSWFNPGAWLLRHAIHENLEYITDSKVLQRGVDKKTYQFHLLKVSQYAGKHPEIANHFNFKNLKRRIAMMNRKKSSVLQLGNYVFAVPVIAVLVLVFSVSRAYQQESADEGTPDFGSPPAPARQLPADTLRIGFNPHITGPESEQPANDADEQLPVATGPKPSRPGDGNQGTNRKTPAVTKIVIAEADSTRVPLFVVDGIPMKGNSFMEEMNPEDIASISVWKNGERQRLAATLYGSAADNGLVVITTKAAENRERAITLDTAANVPHVIGFQRVEDKNKAPMEEKKAASLHLNQLGEVDLNRALIIIDGKESTEVVLNALSSEQIKSLTFLAGKHAKEKYGEKGDEGVVEITTVQ